MTFIVTLSIATYPNLFNQDGHLAPKCLQFIFTPYKYKLHDWLHIQLRRRKVSQTSDLLVRYHKSILIVHE